MIEGVCPKCSQGYSPFTAEEYKINLPQKTMPDQEKSKDTTVKE